MAAPLAGGARFQPRMCRAGAVRASRHPAAASWPMPRAGQILASGGPPGPAVSQRVRQKERTRAALITAARQLILDGAGITMMGAATAVGVSEATAYRHFPDLPSLLREAFTGLWPDTPEDLAGAGDYGYVPERVAQATDFLLRNVARMQGAVRVMIASTITRDDATFPRPGKQFGLID